MGSWEGMPLFSRIHPNPWFALLIDSYLVLSTPRPSLLPSIPLPQLSRAS